jgi:hypothetical protein
LASGDDEVSLEMARARAEARASADGDGSARRPPRLHGPEIVLPPAPPPPPPAPELPSPPDPRAVNESWSPPSLQGGGIAGALRRAAHRLVRKQLDARVRFDSDQVRLDNELLEYVTAHFAATHRHYDRLIAADAVRMNEIDERHVLVQKGVVAHIEDLMNRVELVLEAAERSRLSSESDLRRILPRLEALERRLDEMEKGRERR